MGAGFCTELAHLRFQALEASNDCVIFLRHLFKVTRQFFEIVIHVPNSRFEPRNLKPEILFELVETYCDFVKLAVDPLELLIDLLEMGIDPLELLIDPLELDIDPLELAVDALKLAVDTLKLAVHPIFKRHKTVIELFESYSWFLGRHYFSSFRWVGRAVILPRRNSDEDGFGRKLHSEFFVHALLNFAR